MPKTTQAISIQKHQDTRPIHLNSFLLNGGIIYHNDGYKITFDQNSNRFVLLRDLDRYVFETLESCACFLAFADSDRGIIKNKTTQDRFEWFVLDLDEVYAAFYRKRDAVRCCYRLNEDKRVSKSIYKLENGLYEYTGPAHYESKPFYIGTRQVLLKNDFAPILEKWDRKVLELIQNAKNHTLEDRTKIY